LTEVVAGTAPECREEGVTALMSGDRPALRSRSQRLSMVAATLSLAIVAAACTGTSKDQSPPSSPVAVSDEDIAAYGYGVGPDVSVTLQPDVVVIENGPAAVRSVSADGIVWTMDARAKGMSKVHVGAVMFATSRAVGRVLDIRDEGSNKVVVLGPVELTEIISDGTIKVSQNLDLEKFWYQPVPDLPGAFEETDLGSDASEAEVSGATFVGETVVTLPVLRMEASPSPSPKDGPLSAGKLPRPSGNGSLEIPLGNWKMKPYGGGGRLGITINHDAPLKVGIDLAFTSKNLRINTEARVTRGLLKQSGTTIEGIDGLEVDLTAGAANGTADNKKIKAEVPVEMNIPIPPSPATGGLPLNAKVTFKLILATALTGNNATLLASGRYGLKGPLGIEGLTIVTPEFSVEKSLMKSIGGITLGPSGLVVAFKAQFMLGAGTSAASVGPFASLTASVGVTNGSSLGAPLARCRGGSLDIKIAGGAKVDVSEAAQSIFNKILPPKSKVDASFEVGTSLVHRQEVVPEVPLCTAALDSLGGLA
jgi:hypothetical protein